jgi:hypothetical protein
MIIPGCPAAVEYAGLGAACPARSRLTGGGSTERSLTTHAGSLPRPEPLIAVNRAKLAGRGFDEKIYEARRDLKKP